MYTIRCRFCRNCDTGSSDGRRSGSTFLAGGPHPGAGGLLGPGRSSRQLSCDPALFRVQADLGRKTSGKVGSFLRVRSVGSAGPARFSLGTCLLACRMLLGPGLPKPTLPSSSGIRIC